MARSKKLRNPKDPNWNYVWNRVVSGGWNTGFSAEALALIEGYDQSVVGEDMSIGEKMSMIRGDGNLPNLEVVGTVGSRSQSTPRRFIQELASGEGAYDDFMNDSVNAQIREESMPEALERIKHVSRIEPANEQLFNDWVKSLSGWSATVTPNRAEANAFSRRLLVWLGFEKSDYTLDETTGELNVTNWDNVKDALNKYRARYDARQARRAPAPAAP
jgi:hypothetical protein